MKALKISGKKREVVGKSSTKALRNAGFVPCVVYGGEIAPLHIAVEEKQFKNLVYTPNVYKVVLTLDDDKPIEVVLQDIQFHPVNGKILHLDFIKLEKDKKVTLSIPVRLEGNSPGVIKGGKLRIVNRKVRVKSLPANLPDELRINIGSLEIGDKVYIEEIDQSNFKLMHPSNMVIVDVKTSRVAAKTTEEEEEAEKEEVKE